MFRVKVCFAVSLRGLRILCSLLVLCATFFQPLLPSLLASEHNMACCRKAGKHACCSRLAKAQKIGLRAAPDCCKSCCQKAQVSPSLDLAVLPLVVTADQLILPAQVRIAGTGKLIASPLPDSLFQRPPPSFLSL